MFFGDANAYYKWVSVKSKVIWEEGRWKDGEGRGEREERERERERGERERDAIEKKGWELVRGRVYT